MSREKLLSVSARLFARGGFEATSMRDIAKRAGTIEHIAEAPRRLRRVLPAPAIGHLNLVTRDMSTEQSSGDDFEAALFNEPIHLLRDLGRDAMTVNVPPRPTVAEEQTLLPNRKRLPQRVAERPKGVDCRPPSDFR